MIEHSELLKWLHYEPETGVFTWLKTKHRAVAGTNAAKLNGGDYLRVYFNYKRYSAHRLAWFYVYGSWPSLDIDHINGIKTDNRILNLREATKSQNRFNSEMVKKNKAGFKGVCRDGVSFKATAKINGISFHIGSFKTAKDASNAYQSYAKANHGEFYKQTEANHA